MGSSSLVCSKQPPPHGGRLLETLLQALLQALLQTLLQTPPRLICAGEARTVRRTPVVRPLRPRPP